MHRRMYPKLQTAPTVMDRATQMAHRVFVRHIHRGQGEMARSRQAKRLDPIIQLFQASNGAGDRHHIPAPDCQMFGHGRAKPARGAGDEGEFSGHRGLLWQVS